MANTRDLRRRIKSIDNTRQITRAMEMVAATKMRRAQAAVKGSRAYADKAAELFRAVAATPEAAEHPLLVRGRGGSSPNLAIIVMGSDRGLAGALNTNVLRHALTAAQQSGGSARFVSVGRKIQTSLRVSGQEIIATFTGLLDTPELPEVSPIVQLVTDEFTSGAIDKVQLVYPKFESTLVNHPELVTLLPAASTPATITAEETGRGDTAKTETSHVASSAQTLFEPNPSAVLDSLVPRLLETQLYQALLETKASEHSSRMVAMRNASNNANDLLDEVKFTLNQARQAAITTEIAEIAAAQA